MFVEMRVLHSYCLNYNIGDYALGIGVKNLLRNFLPIDFIGETNLQGRYFNEYYISQVVNKKYDLLVVGGGGIIHGSHWPNDWFWLIDKDLIQSIKIPFIIYGVGDNYFQDERIPDRAIDHIKETFRHALSFSVRNDGSLERVINDIGIHPEEVPDPGFYVGLNTEYSRPINDKYVIIQVANDKAGHRFGSDLNRKQFVLAMKKIARYLSSSYKVLFAPHVYDDVALSKEIMGGIENCYMWDFGYLAFDHSDKAVGYYKYAEFVLSMRGHGQILPISFGVPTIALCNHPKHKGLMEKLSLSDWVVTIDDPRFGELVIEKIEALKKENSSFQERLHLLNAKMLDNTTRFFDELNLKLARNG